jgi:pimeloyl-ACP methyl ester carboxylesterase
MSRGSYDLIDGAGHAAHLERPETTAERITSFLAD